MALNDYFPIWKKLTADQQQRIEAVAELHTIRSGTLVHDGSPDCKGLLLVQSGQLRAYLLSEEGRELTICRFFEMDICLFSASCVMPNMQFTVLVEAEKDTEIWVIPACLYQNLMDESVALSNFSHDLITGHFTDVMWLIEQVLWKSFDKRLAEFLLTETAVEDSNILSITHERIANHMGTAREVVTRMLRYFQTEGLVRLTRGAVEVVDPKGLQAVRDGV